MCTEVLQVCATAEHSTINQHSGALALAGIPLAALLLVAEGTLKPRCEKVHQGFLLS